MGPEPETGGGRETKNFVCPKEGVVNNYFWGPEKYLFSGTPKSFFNALFFFGIKSKSFNSLDSLKLIRFGLFFNIISVFWTAGLVSLDADLVPVQFPAEITSRTRI